MAAILHIEDDPDWQLHTQAALGGEHTVVAVSSLAEAIVALKAQPWDEIVLDLNLRDSRGHDTIAAVKKYSFATPVFVQTAAHRWSLGSLETSDVLFKEKHELLDAAEYLRLANSLLGGPKGSEGAPLV